MKKLSEIISKIITLLESVFLTASVAVMCTVVFIQVLLRYFFSSSIPWAEELAMYLMIWITCVGASVAVEKKHHIVIDVAMKILPASKRNFAHSISYIISAIVCFATLKIGLDFVQETMQYGRTSIALKLPMWIVYSALPFASFFMGMHFLLHFVKSLEQKK